LVVVQFSPAIPCNQHSVPLARFAILVLGLDLYFLKHEYRPVVAAGFDREHAGVKSRYLEWRHAIDKLLPCMFLVGSLEVEIRSQHPLDRVHVQRHTRFSPLGVIDLNRFSRFCRTDCRSTLRPGCSRYDYRL
jgi:hypothetical protein